MKGGRNGTTLLLLSSASGFRYLSVLSCRFSPLLISSHRSSLLVSYLVLCVFFVSSHLVACLLISSYLFSSLGFSSCLLEHSLKVPPFTGAIIVAPLEVSLYLIYFLFGAMIVPPPTKRVVPYGAMIVPRNLKGRTPQTFLYT